MCSLHEFAYCISDQNCSHYMMVTAKVLSSNKLTLFSWENFTVLQLTSSTASSFLYTGPLNSSVFLPCLNFHFLAGRSSIHYQRYLPSVAWSHHTAWMKTLTCLFQTSHWKEQRKNETMFPWFVIIAHGSDLSNKYKSNSN